MDHLLAFYVGTVHERISFRLLCPKVFFPDAVIMENNPGDKVVVHV